MNNKIFYIYDHWLMPTPYNHRFFVEKFAEWFKFYNFDIQLIKSYKEITKPWVVMISSHNALYWYDRWEVSKIYKLIMGWLLWFSDRICIWNIKLFWWIATVAQQLKRFHLSKFLQFVQDKDILITSRFTHIDEDLFSKYHAKIIYSGDHYYVEPWELWKSWFKFYQSHINTLPVKFSASVDPCMKGDISDFEKTIDVGFVGARSYKKDWYGYYKEQPNCEIFGTPPYISEEQRVAIYQWSKIILWFHSDENIKNWNVTERVFEALAYWAVCITDNPSAKIATNDSVIVITTKDDLIYEVNKLLSDREYYDFYHKKWIDFIYSKWLYYHRAKELLELGKKLFSLDF